MTPEQARRHGDAARRLAAAAETALLVAIARRVLAAAGRPVSVHSLAARAMARLLPALRRLVRRAVEDAWQAGEAAADRELGADKIGAQVTPAARAALARAERRRLQTDADHQLALALAAVPDLTERRWRSVATDPPGFRFDLRTALPLGEPDDRATRLERAQHALDRLAAEGVTGFRDRAGRRWELAAYVEMAVRTTTAQAALNGTLGRLQDHGIDLVYVPDVPGECARCRPWEGRVLSISGTDPEHPSVAVAVAAGLHHPGCRHNLVAYRPGVTPLPRATADAQGDRERQRTRELERQVRAWRRREAAAITPDAQVRARAGLRAARARLHAHVEATSPKTRRYSDQRTRIAGAR